MRDVTIELRCGTFWVLFVDRKKHGHYAAAQFEAQNHSEADVRNWVSRQSNLNLVEGP